MFSIGLEDRQVFSFQITLWAIVDRTKTRGQILPEDKEELSDILN